VIRDLSGTGSVEEDADVAIIGAGTVGLLVATRLAAHGLSVVCLESGGWTQEGEEHPLNDVVQVRARYAGAASGRFRCLGGTSTRWGGALIPFLPQDVAQADWPLAVGEILKFREEVEQVFGLHDGPYEFPELLPPGATHVGRLAKWPAFRKRNMFQLLQAPARAADGPRIWLQATVTDFAVEAGRLQAITARAPDGAQLRVRAPQFIVAAGAIESTRLLLLLDRDNDGILTREGDTLGRFFHDHLSVPVADLTVIDRPAFNKLVGFRFESGGVMRNLRFELAGQSGARRSVPPCFAHIAFEERGRSGFGALRELFRHLQRRQAPPLSTWRDLLVTAPWLARAVWWRFVEKRLLYPDRATIQVHLVIQQEAVAHNRITLSADRFDRFGKPLAQIDWAPGERDVRHLTAAADLIEALWRDTPLGCLAAFRRRAPGTAEAELARGGGVYHPGGSTRMANSAGDGVVDADLRVFGLPNLRVLSTSVFPTGGGANPTMMLLMLGLRCVDQMVRA
jgi:choline dehydrogenase-like flavoprotein